MSVLVEIGQINRNAGVKDGIEFVAVGYVLVKINQRGDLVWGVDLISLQVRFQSVQLVWVCLPARDRRPVGRGKGVLDDLGIVLGIQNENVVLLRMRTIQTRQRLNRLDARCDPSCPSRQVGEGRRPQLPMLQVIYHTGFLKQVLSEGIHGIANARLSSPAHFCVRFQLDKFMARPSSPLCLHTSSETQAGKRVRDSKPNVSIASVPRMDELSDALTRLRRPSLNRL